MSGNFWWDVNLVFLTSEWFWPLSLILSSLAFKLCWVSPEAVFTLNIRPNTQSNWGFGGGGSGTILCPVSVLDTFPSNPLEWFFPGLEWFPHMHEPIGALLSMQGQPCADHWSSLLPILWSVLRILAILFSRLSSPCCQLKESAGFCLIPFLISVALECLKKLTLISSRTHLIDVQCFSDHRS